MTSGLFHFLTTSKSCRNRPGSALYLNISTFGVVASKAAFSDWFLLGLLLPSKPACQWCVLFCRSDSDRGVNLVGFIKSLTFGSSFYFLCSHMSVAGLPPHPTPVLILAGDMPAIWQTSNPGPHDPTDPMMRAGIM